jgi:carbonic anhydrase
MTYRKDLQPRWGALALPNKKNSVTCGCHDPKSRTDRRAVLKSISGMLSLSALGAMPIILPALGEAAALTKETRDALTTDQIIATMKAGNERFMSGKPSAHDYIAQKRATARGQYPAAAILSCIDSRAPAEIILDTGIGETFNARVAGNIVNDDVLGSLEFSCALAGAKVVLVMGHTACGAIKGAIDHAELGHLTDLLDKIKPAVTATAFDGERTSKNPAFVDAVAKTHVLLTAAAIRARSTVLNKLENDGKIKIFGAMYNLIGGRVDFLI